ncbi:uncharacterized protein A4U43_C10F4130 [Asparagus officinalis]|uniref:Uncharacterized protein n=1 Tax=Asparagus officinalis TaxID=4686 RepID=A0A5P1E0I6_ASPOF|nr:uncharacterized protein A4U43_C10F4130 [Asparagus officinalis]
MLDDEERRGLRVCDSEELEKECRLIGMRSWRGGMLELEKEVPRRLLSYPMFDTVVEKSKQTTIYSVGFADNSVYVC